MQNKKLDTLTSLRFFAAAMIVIGHAHALFGSAGIATTFSLVQGVSFFFVLSGFILAYNYPRLDSAAAIGKFWLARFARVWPAHIAVVLLLLLVAGVSNTDGLAPGQKVVAFLANVFLLQSLIPYKDYFLSFNGVAWSISTEWMFYLAFPLLLLNVRRRGLLLLALLASIVLNHLLLGALWRVTDDESVRSLNLMGLLYVNPVVRIFEFFIGMLACQVYQEVAPRTSLSSAAATVFETGAILAAVGAMYLSPRIVELAGGTSPFANVLSYYLTKSGGAPVFFFLILVFALQRGWLSWVLNRPVFVFLGEISFALYLVHTSVLEWFVVRYEMIFSHFPVWASYIAYWLACIFAAYLLYAIVEKPCRRIILGSRSLSWREMWAVIAGKKQLGLGIAGLIFVLGAGSWRIGHGCSETDCARVHQRAAYRNVALFPKIAELQAMEVNSTAQGMTINLLWKAIHPDSKMKVALHVLDRNGRIVWQHDYAMSKSIGLKAGERWIDTVDIPKTAIAADCDHVGIAMYKLPVDLMKVEAPKTDWDSKRALLELAEFRAARL